MDMFIRVEDMGKGWIVAVFHRGYHLIGESDTFRLTKNSLLTRKANMEKYSNDVSQEEKALKVMEGFNV